MIYAIGDLHLSFSTNKPMDVFGAHWENHYEKIKAYWLENVSDEDLVIIPGDFSWAMNLNELKMDMDFIEPLPGTKLLLKGNHDYWWQSLTQLKKTYASTRINFLQNDCFIYNGISVCGTRGWLCPHNNGFTEEDEKIYKRELERLRLSLTKAKQQSEILVLMHFPPMNELLEPSGFTKLFDEFGVKYVIYGHIHGIDNFRGAPNGNINGIHYQLVSADYLEFELLQVPMLEGDFNDITK